MVKRGRGMSDESIVQKRGKSHCSTWKCSNCQKESNCDKAYKMLIWTFLTSDCQYGCSKYINRWDSSDFGSPSPIDLEK